MADGWLSNVIVVVENPSDSHNLDRLRRVCRAFGVRELRLIQEAKEEDPRCRKALRLDPSVGRVVLNTAQCMQDLAREGITSFATSLGSSVNLYDLRFDRRKMAFWFGQEKYGLTEEVQSLNVAVSAAVILAEVARQVAFGLAPCPFASPIDPVESSSRAERFLAIARRRQRGLVVVLEDPDRLDAAAILRSCDAFGVAEVHFIFETSKAFDPLANRQVTKSEGSNLWVCSRVFGSVAECRRCLDGFVHRRLAQGPSVLGSRLGEEPKLALWLTRRRDFEPLGLGPGADADADADAADAAASDAGLAASGLAAATLAELVRQRRSSASPESWCFGPEEQDAYVRWCEAVHAKRHTSLPQASLGEAEMSPEYERLGRLRAELARQGW
ncbi:unnamed protein product [Effrenium voratum]|uniref:tRNA/rRNA methyltransferase SpoU type domain-containing protein n=1 Tax=Effrenium voratum TaxID=2562239 RepID=A0AA36IFA2_9DINO|nr:unnamed protein product [Effrenium voratum]CAJ1459826.1 unnamed protein product [Effrenium voratum]